MAGDAETRKSLRAQAPTSVAPGQDAVPDARRRLLSKAALGLPAVMTLHAGSALAQASAVQCLVNGNYSTANSSTTPFREANPLTPPQGGTGAIDDPRNVNTGMQEDPTEQQWLRQVVTVETYDDGTNTVTVYTDGNGNYFDFTTGEPTTQPSGTLMSSESGDALLYVSVNQDGTMIGMPILVNNSTDPLDGNPVTLSCYSSFG